MATVPGPGPTALAPTRRRAHTQIMDTRSNPVLDHQGLEVLDADTCWTLVNSTAVGRIAFVDAGEPVVFPVTHRVDGRTVVFRTSYGSKLLAASMGRPIAFEVDAWDTADRHGWSVLMRGSAEEVLEAEELDDLAHLGLEPWADAVPRTHWVRIRADEITGRRIPAA